MLLYPNPKINIGLNVLRRRSDGYHDIETLFVPYKGIKDALEVVYSEEPSMHRYGLKYPGSDEDDLCMKAWRLMEREHGIPPVAIHLYKNIPVGAGLGGGSSDCAFTLVALNDLFSLGLSKSCLAEYAASLGSDCPFFIYNTPMLASGRGEHLEPSDVDLSDYEIRLETPQIHVSTAEAYSGVKPQEPAVSLRDSLLRPVEEWHHCIKNDFEPSVFALHPQIEQIKQRFYDEGAIYAAMSGSGSSVYGLFRR